MPDSESANPGQKPAETSSEELSFDEAEFSDETSPEFACSACSNPIRDTYFRAGESVLCSSCRWAAEAEAAKPRPGGSKRFGKAALYGLGAAAAGTLIYFLVLWGTGYEVGLISILVGWLVGKAVFAGSENVGGRKYQVMAVALTYFSICASYAPLIVQEMLKSETEAAEAPADAVVQIPKEGEEAQALTAEQIAQAQPMPENPEDIEPGDVYRLDTESAEESGITVVGAAVAVAFILVISLAAPFLAGFENILGLLIIGFGLFEAWKHSGAREVVFEGPFSVGE